MKTPAFPLPPLAALCAALLALFAASCSTTKSGDDAEADDDPSAEVEAAEPEQPEPEPEPEPEAELAEAEEEENDDKKKGGFRWFRSPSDAAGDPASAGVAPEVADADADDAAAEAVAEADPEPGKKKRRGFFSWFTRKKDDPEDATDDGSVAAAAGDLGPGVSAVQEIEIDKDAPLGTQFLQACASAALGASGGSVAGRDGWYFDAGELTSLAGGASPGRSAVVAIAEYARQLRGEGVQLVVVPVPPKAVVYPDELTKEWKLSKRHVERFDSPLRALYADLAGRGVMVVDPGSAMLDQRDAKTGRMFPKTYGAWSPRAAELTAGLVAEKIRTSGWLTDSLRKTGISTMEATLGVSGDLAGGTSETVPARIVKLDGGTMSPTSSAPLLVLAGGDGAAYRESGASFADQLAAELRVTFDLVATGSDGRNVPRSRALQKSLSSPGYVTRRKCVVWVIGGEEFLSRDWRFVPVDLRLQQSEEGLRSSG